MTRSSRAFSSEVDTGSREENASKQESRAPFQFYRNGKGSSGLFIRNGPSLGQIRPGTVAVRRTTMNSTLSLAELDDRIAVLRDNLRQLVEQAAAASGSQNEERAADRIAQQTDELDKLVAERDSRTKK